MKSNRLRSKPASIAKTRWTAYATAGAATALVGSNSAEAAIHYSGLVIEKFPPHSNKTKSFQLDQPGHSIGFEHGNPHSGFAMFGFVASGSGGAVRGVFT